MKNIVNITVWMSIFVQLLTTIIPFDAIVKLKESDKILKKILIIETIVQIVEFTFYICILFLLKI